jgi:hypothetical protein
VGGQTVGTGGVPGGSGGKTNSAGGGGGTTMATTAVASGEHPSSHGGRFVAMVSPTPGESFVAPASLRLIAVGRDPNIYTNSPRDGLGGNAAKVQFIVDDKTVLEVAGDQAEYWVFKGFAANLPAGQHRVWARATYVSPAEVLDSPATIVEIAAPPTYDKTVELAADVTLSGTTGYELVGAPGKRIRLNGNGHSITSSSAIGGPITLKYVDVYDLGDRSDTKNAAIDVTTSGTMTIEDSVFDSSNTVRMSATGAAAVSIQRNLLRSNMRMPLGQFPGTDIASSPSYPVMSLSGTSTGAKVFAGNTIGAGYVEWGRDVKNWTVGGDSDAASNVLIGPRVGLSVNGQMVVRRNYSHHVYYGGWSQGCNFELGGTADALVEHNVIYGSSWPVRGVGGDFRYNLILDAGHEWLWAGVTGAQIHHNVFVGGEGDVGGIYVLYSPSDVKIFNNTLDGLDSFGPAIKMDNGSIAFTSNAIIRMPGKVWNTSGGTLVADYNLYNVKATNNYADGRTPAHDVTGDPLFSDLPKNVFDMDEAGVWKRTVTTADVLRRYRARYTPKAGSPAIDTGDPAGGAGNDVGAVGAGTANDADKFGAL